MYFWSKYGSKYRITFSSDFFLQKFRKNLYMKMDEKLF